MKPSDYFRKAVKDYISQRERGAQKDLAQKSGITPRHLNDFLGKRRSMVEEDQLKITKIIGVDYISFIQRGKNLLEGVSLNSKPHTFIIQTHTEAQKDFINTEHYIPVPLYEKGKIAAFSGGSAFDPFETPESHVMIYSPELNHRTRHNLVAARVGGDSMEPLIPEGSIIVIDLSDREFFNNKVYLVSADRDIDLHLAVKRVRKFETAEGFLLLSENHEYDPRLVIESDWLRLCVGRVVWMWRSFDRDF